MEKRLPKLNLAYVLWTNIAPRSLPPLRVPLLREYSVFADVEIVLQSAYPGVCSSPSFLPKKETHFSNFLDNLVFGTTTAGMWVT